ncbi:hypothetical protein [Streptomyces avicenniae]|uniref:hypothetical protein n=1 Tax=Streptomyces avicenniae TaxID=500153 RepID=UPI000699E867|nr:hypothetical protein [Streptomyces avicenniae]
MSRLTLRWLHTITTRLQGRYTDRGAGFVEYAGLLLLIAGIVGAVIGLGLADRIGNFISAQVDSVIG